VSWTVAVPTATQGVLSTSSPRPGKPASLERLKSVTGRPLQQRCEGCSIAPSWQHCSITVYAAPSCAHCTLLTCKRRRGVRSLRVHGKGNRIRYVPLGRSWRDRALPGSDAPWRRQGSTSVPAVQQQYARRLPGNHARRRLPDAGQVCRYRWH
jgi:hypothetical protein